MSKIILSIAAVATSLVALPAYAAPITVMDSTLDLSYSGNNPANYSAPGFSGPSTGDFIGSDFDTEKVVATVGEKSIELQYYTTFGGNDLGAKYADIFLASTNDANAAPSVWNYGLSLGFQGAASQGIYGLSGASDYQTSLDIWGPKGTGYIYGGSYIAPDLTTQLAPTRVTDGDPLAGWTVATTEYASGEAAYPYIVDAILTAPSDAAFSDAFDASYIDIFWGTGDCDNDALFAEISRVPEPLSISLVGAGLAGIVGFGRRRKRSKAQNS